MKPLERYDRQVRLEGWDQEKLFSSRVFVAGAGALGCEVAKDLAMMGVGRLIIADYDKVELSNLSRQLLFRDSDIGREKAEAAAERLRELNPHVEVESHDKDIRELGEDVYRSSDVLLSCLDNWASRRWFNSMAVSLEKPLIDGGINGFYGNVQIVIPGKTACLECQSALLIPKEERAAECTLRKRRPADLVEELRLHGLSITLREAEELFDLNIKTVYDIKYFRPEKLTERISQEVIAMLNSLKERIAPRMPAIQSVAATIAGIMATHTIQILHGDGLGPVPTSLIVYDGYHSRLSKVKIGRDQMCIVCGESEKEPIPFRFRLSSTVYELKEAVATKLGVPDPEVLYISRRLDDLLTLTEAGVSYGETLYISTSRLYEPLAIRIVRMDEGSDEETSGRLP
jgi:molybdopterin/thiamine biosynthesis adenylyltransferase